MEKSLLISWINLHVTSFLYCNQLQCVWSLDTACLENVGKLHCQEEPSSSHVLNTATVPHTAAVSSHTQSPTEGKTNPCKEVLNLLVKKGAPDSESEDKCSKYRFNVPVSRLCTCMCKVIWEVTKVLISGSKCTCFLFLQKFGRLL